MAETQQEPVDKYVTDDLRVIVEGTEKRVFIKDKNGQQRRLWPLVLADFIEFENELGVSIFEVANAKLSIKHITFLLFLSLRKEGCNVEDIKRRNFKISRDQILQDFDGGFLTSSVETFTAILQVSGFGRKGKTENPPAPASQQGSDPAKATTPESANTK